MKITHKVMTETDFIDDILCNKCGKSCINKDAPSPEGLIEVQVRGGYGSNILGDGSDFRFSICETCLGQMILAFEIPPSYDDSLGSSTTFEEWCTWATKQLGEKNPTPRTAPT